MRSINHQSKHPNSQSEEWTIPKWHSICKATALWDYLSFSFFFKENVPVELREPLYKDQYDQEHLKPSISKLLLSPEIYCRAQALLAQAHGASLPASQGSPADNSALLQFLIKKGFTPKVQDADVTEGDLSNTPIKTVRVCGLALRIGSSLCPVWSEVVAEVLPIILQVLLFHSVVRHTHPKNTIWSKVKVSKVRV